MTITEKIREDWGTMKHFCKKNDVPYESLRVMLGGIQKSQQCVDALISHGYITKASDLPQYKSKKAA